MDGGIQPALILSGCTIVLSVLSFIAGQSRQKRLDHREERDEGAVRAQVEARMTAIETAMDNLKREIIDKLAYRDVAHERDEERSRRIALEAELAKYRGGGGSPK